MSEKRIPARAGEALVLYGALMDAAEYSTRLAEDLAPIINVCGFRFPEQPKNGVRIDGVAGHHVHITGPSGGMALGYCQPWEDIFTDLRQSVVRTPQDMCSLADSLEYVLESFDMVEESFYKKLERLTGRPDFAAYPMDTRKAWITAIDGSIELPDRGPAVREVYDALCRLQDAGFAQRVRALRETAGTIEFMRMEDRLEDILTGEGTPMSVDADEVLLYDGTDKEVTDCTEDGMKVYLPVKKHESAQCVALDYNVKGYGSFLEHVSPSFQRFEKDGRVMEMLAARLDRLPGELEAVESQYYGAVEQMLTECGEEMEETPDLDDQERE
jgi:hypothetical protein